METNQQEAGNGRVLEVSGRLDLRVAPELRERLSEALGAAGGRLVVDLSKVEFIDSSALGVLVRIHRDAEALAGRLVLVSPEGPAKQIFTLTRTDGYFSLCQTVDEALAVG